MPLVAGVDSSTQSCTVVLRDADDGRIVEHARAPHPVTTPPVSEQQPRSWWSALETALSGVRGSDIAAISVDAQCHGLVSLDDADRVIRPVKLWNDTTSSGEARDLVEMLGRETWAQRTGSVPVSSFTISKLLWLKRHEPHNFDRIASVLMPGNWLTFRLTGEKVTDRGDSSGTGYFSPAESAWCPDLLHLVDDATDWLTTLPRILDPQTAAGGVTRSAAGDLGLRSGVVVGPGTGDNMASALGLGVRLGDVVVSLGTSGVVFATHSESTADPTGAVNGNADATGGYLPVVCTLNAAKVTDAFARLLGVDHEQMAALALQAPANPDRPVLVPYLDGERVPNRPGATGLLAGLRSNLAREEVARAAYEGVVAGLLTGLEALADLGVATNGRLILTGGAARSVAYRQLLADLACRPVYVADLDETAAAGAAVQAAATLLEAKVADVASAWAPAVRQVAEPRPEADAEALLARYHTVAAFDGLDRSSSDHDI
jgi:xylulokinase